MVCTGFQDRTCWHRRLKDNRYCSSCQLLADRHRLQALLKQVEESQESDDMILSYVSMPGLFDLLADYSSYLEELMILLFKKRTSLILSFYQMIQNSQLHIPFLHILRGHEDSGFCKVFRLLANNSLYQDSLLPYCCLQCYTTCILSTEKKYIQQQIFTHLYLLVWGNPSGELFRLFQRIVQKPNSLPALQNFCNSLIESTLFDSTQDRERHLRSVFHTITLLMRQHPTRFPQPIPRHFPGWVLSHPLLFPEYFESPSPWTVYAKRSLKKRLDVFREELMAKTWHPSRFQHWCEDIDDQKFNIEQGIQGPIPSLRGHHALWNIRWI